MASLTSEHIFRKYKPGDFKSIYIKATKIIEMHKDSSSDKNRLIKGNRNSMFDIIREPYFFDEENSKILEYARSQDCIIDYDRYDNIILMSDIHADFISFFVSLLQNDIIELVGIVDGMKEHFIHDIISSNPENRSKIIANILTKFSFNFVKRNTVFIILGDIVDGKRKYRSFVKNVDNSYGINELLIHMVLYNMRLDAINMNSNVICVIGNHDMESVIKPLSDPDHIYFYNNYVDYNTHICLGDAFRRKILLPFYLFDSSVFKLIARGTNIIGYLSHASFSSFMNPKLDYVSILDTSDGLKITKYRALYNDIRNDIFNAFLDNAHVHSYEKGILDSMPLDIRSSELKDHHYLMSYTTWSRYFPESLSSILRDSTLRNNTTDTIPKCTEITENLGLNSFAVMGHCISAGYSNVTGHTGYDYCDNNHECIVSACVKNNIPKLILIDNAVSYSNTLYGNPARSDFETIYIDDDRTGDDIGLADIKQLKQMNNFMKFNEILHLIKDASSSHYRYIVARTNFFNDEKVTEKDIDIKTIFYEIDKSSDVLLPRRTVIDDPYKPSIAHGGMLTYLSTEIGKIFTGGGSPSNYNYKKYMLYKEKCKNAK